MKFFSYFAVLALFVLAFTSTNVVAQSAPASVDPTFSIAEVFNRNSGVLKNPLKGLSATDSAISDGATSTTLSSKRRKPPSATTDEPGTSPLFLLHGSKQFIRIGESVTYSLVAMQGIQRTVCVYGQVLKPGQNLSYDGTYPAGYFQSETGRGGCISGASVGSFVKIHTRTANPEDLQGTTIINLVILDENGQLLQQILADLYVVRGGPWALTSYVKIAKPTSSELWLYGRFPLNVPIYYMIGIPELGYSLSGGDPSSAIITGESTKLTLPGYPRYGSASSLDFMGWDPVTRQAIIAPSFMIALQ